MHFSFFSAGCLLLASSPAVMARRSMREIQVEKELEEFNSANDGSNFRSGVGATDAVPQVYWQNVSLPIDYSGGYQGNFTNRYWVVDEYYEEGGPVFSFDTGESNGGQGYLGYMTRNTSFFNQFLREFKGLGIVWEHRYYGESNPFPVNLNTTAEQFKYLTTENALKDFDVFANQFSWKNYTVSPKQTPWVVVGGSYPGMRAAFLRHLYPETVYAAYAASPPVQAQVDMSAYWEQAYRGLVKYGYQDCTDRIQLAISHIDSQLSSSKSAAKLKQQYLGRTAEKGSNAGFADILLFPMYNWQSSGADSTFQAFCTHLSAEAPPAKASKKELAKFYSDRWASWPGFISLVNEYLSFGYCEGPVPSTTTEPNCLLDEKFDGQLSISWTWQYCTEWGFFQSTNLGAHALGSKYNSQKHQQELCYRQFPDGLSSGLLPKKPKTDYINSVTDGWYMRPSNVFFTEGEFDPWRTLSPLSNEQWSPNFKVTNEIPKCGASTSRKEIFGFLLPDAQHCYDFHAGFAGATAPLELFTKALSGWLGCFKKH